MQSSAACLGEQPTSVHGSPERSIIDPLREVRSERHRQMSDLVLEWYFVDSGITTVIGIVTVIVQVATAIFVGVAAVFAKLQRDAAREQALATREQALAAREQAEVAKEQIKAIALDISSRIRSEHLSDANGLARLRTELSKAIRLEIASLEGTSAPEPETVNRIVEIMRPYQLEFWRRMALEADYYLADQITDEIYLPWIKRLAKRIYGIEDPVDYCVCDDKGDNCGIDNRLFSERTQKYKEDATIYLAYEESMLHLVFGSIIKPPRKTPEDGHSGEYKDTSLAALLKEIHADFDKYRRDNADTNVEQNLTIDTLKSYKERARAASRPLAKF